MINNMITMKKDPKEEEVEVEEDPTEEAEVDTSKMKTMKKETTHTEETEVVEEAEATEVDMIDLMKRDPEITMMIDNLKIDLGEPIEAEVKEEPEDLEVHQEEDMTISMKLKMKKK